ncbi:multicopper oxidase domain-containing protein [Arthrobacter sp. JZ12]|uniref:multicopper oxidase domain-containing protein n=1 Tax=Arthrobacter sp. JZ12 TaxID=2654190 RepID=UPI002B460B20|nr:multicopper oxidase domain-containing protein [Arthrobacter sp. JZ12]WRH24538.1 multicopper oxidase domain-containing protein [Arthrobacter sp. JZ12]
MSPLTMHINEGYLPMVDGSLVYHRGFGDRASAISDPQPALKLSPHVFTADGVIIASRAYPLEAATPASGRPAPLQADPEYPLHYLARRAHWASYFPERTLIAEAGSTISIQLHNNLAQPHSLRFHSAGPAGEDVTSPAVPPGGTTLLTFDAPEPGTYLFSDPVNAPVERTLGLYGALVVIDPENAWRLSADGAEFERQWLWMCHDVEPNWARIAASGQTVDPVTTPAVPRYFTLNGYAGFQSLALTTDNEFNTRRKEDTLPSGLPRETDVRNFSASPGPGAIRTGHLMRMVNAGVADHQLHYHGNHVWTVRADGVDFPRINGVVSPVGDVLLQQWEDTIQLQPLQRKEAILPMRRPPEVTDEVWNARQEEWVYPMHCHAEPSQTAAGGLYPGGLLADWILAEDTTPESGLPGTAADDPHHVFRSQVDFASDQPHEGSPETEFPLRPDVSMELDFFSRDLEFPDGAEYEVWSFENDKSGRQLPGPTVRITEGQIFHGTIKPSKNVHTVHWHGIEPDPRNDGVGHTSYEVTGHYTYQWRPDAAEFGNPNRGSAGTYFYHCHVNTPLHVQMGMFGAIVVDPPVDPANPAPAGARRHSSQGPFYDIATETLIGPYSIDPRWHELNHAAGLSGEDVGLNHFVPRNFYLLGGVIPARPNDDRVWAISSMRANVVGPERYPTLVRFMNIDYFPTVTRFFDGAGNPAPIAQLVAHDGRPFWNTPDPEGPATQPSETGDQLLTSIIKSGAAEKFDLLLRPPTPGTYTIAVDFLHWITSEVLATRTVTVTAS